MRGLNSINICRLALPQACSASALLPLLFLALLFLTVMPGPLLAASKPETLATARWYEVEMIIFAHRNPEAHASEHWPEIKDIRLPKGLTEISYPPQQPALGETGLSQPAGDTGQAQVELRAVPLAGSGTAQASESDPWSWVPIPYEFIDPNEFRLNATWQKLQKSSRHEPLIHIAWRQPTYEAEKSATILIYDGMADRAEEPAPETVAGMAAVAGGAQTPARSRFTVGKALSRSRTLQPLSEEDALMGPVNPRIIGTVSLSISRYLHLKADLTYRTLTRLERAVQVPDITLWNNRPYPTLKYTQGPAYTLESWNGIRGFKLEESRRMRSTEIHYLDHPFFGVIVLTTPYELHPPESEAQNPLNVLE